jgi:two-component system phosphate regulon sensor histidine kinase PhoR
MKFLEISSTAIGSPGVEVLKAHALVQLFREVKKEGSLVDEINGPISGGLSFLVSLTYDPERQETLIVLLDTTRLHKLESVRRDFISNLSHELRTPVSVIRANSEALIDGALEDQDAAKKFSKAILKNSEIVKNISEQFSLVSIKVDVDDKLLVKMDPQAFEQVLTNLLENAAKYSSKDIENVVKIRSRKIGSLVRFEVEDNGIGISPEDRERVFERFFRAQNKNTLSTSGTGLGLSIVKNLVNLMGGSVGNEQAHPEGTIFWFSLNSSN